MTDTREKNRAFKIMVIEDSPSTVARYKHEIGNSYPVDFFSDARAALHNYRSSKYDLVVTDLMLPYKSGEGFIFDLKYINPHQKIAVVSGTKESLNLENCPNVQAFDKPINVKEVMDYVLLPGSLRPAIVCEAFGRRRHPRIQVEIDTRAKISFDEKQLSVKIINLSLGGTQLQVRAPLPPNSDLWRVDVPLLGAPLTLEAKRRWVRPAPHSDHMEEVGLQFQSLGHAEYSQLELYLESLQF